MSMSDVSPSGRLSDATPMEWDRVKADRYTDNRDPKEAECTLIKTPAPEGSFEWAPEPDPVNSPTHYTHGGDIECIDAIDAMLGRDGSFKYYEGTMLKYLWRWRHKGGVESLRKLRFFVDRLIEREVKGG